MDAAKFQTYDIYIAAPFFNPVQVGIVSNIEYLCDMHSLTYYSPRRDSGSALLRPEERRRFESWKPILQSNKDAIPRSKMILAVVEYAMPHGYKLVPAKECTMPQTLDYPAHTDWIPIDGAKPVELPDNGVVWECGHADALNIPIFAFHRTKHPNELNLMLSHTVQGMLTGYEKLSILLGNFHQIMNDLSFDTTGLWETPTSEVI